MSLHSTCWIGLIRAIGPATHKKMSMAQLRDACSRAKFESVRTVLATGNVVFSSDKPVSEIVGTLKGVIADHGLSNEVFLRRPEELRTVLAENPFPDATAERPNHMLVLFMATPPAASDLSAIEAYDGPERIEVRGREAFIDYVEGVGKSKLTPARLEKLLGQAGTARNWNTIHKLVDEAVS